MISPRFWKRCYHTKEIRWKKKKRKIYIILDKAKKEVSNEARRNNKEGNTIEQEMAVNPNPRADENINNKNISTNENNQTHEVGSEITDGEDG